MPSIGQIMALSDDLVHAIAANDVQEPENQFPRMLGAYWWAVEHHTGDRQAALDFALEHYNDPPPNRRGIGKGAAFRIAGKFTDAIGPEITKAIDLATLEDHEEDVNAGRIPALQPRPNFRLIGISDVLWNLTRAITWADTDQERVDRAIRVFRRAYPQPA